MIDTETQAHLESGSALIIGTVGADGRPHATRGWGLDVVDAARGVVRVLLAADDADVGDHVATTGRIAITGSDVATLATIQAKGRVQVVEPATAADRRRAARYCDAMFGAIGEVDGTPRELLERLVPTGYLACVVELDEWFDQTPGPRAGAPMGAGAV